MKKKLKSQRQVILFSKNYRNFNFCYCLSKNVLKMQSWWKRKSCYHVTNAFVSRLSPNWPISRLKIFKMSKKCIFGKKLHGQWVNTFIIWLFLGFLSKFTICLLDIILIIERNNNYHPWRIFEFEMPASQDLLNRKWLLETVATIQSV